MHYQAIRGTRDIFPPLSEAFSAFEETAREKAALWGFEELRTPTFEEAGLFQRSIGETTDIVEKEMYVFQDRGGRNLALRPEGTASVARAYIEHEIAKKEKKSRFFYIGSMFRAERPQAGRYREFGQIGFEILGESEPSAEFDLITLADAIFKDFGVKKARLHLNSIGCLACRGDYRQELKNSLEPKAATLCEDCQKRLQRNPFRVLDCKKCSPLLAGLIPPFAKCGACAQHEKILFNLLETLPLPYNHDPKIVRGFDYYTRTVWEFLHPDLGAQSAICSGGRYDNLIKDLGGPEVPAVGLAFGIDRSLEANAAEGKEKPAVTKNKNGVFLCLASNSDAVVSYALKTATLLRENGLGVSYSLFKDSFKSQLRQAGKSRFAYCLILGEDEQKAQSYKLKNLTDGQETDLPWQKLVEKLKC